MFLESIFSNEFVIAWEVRQNDWNVENLCFESLDNFRSQKFFWLRENIWDKTFCPFYITGWYDLQRQFDILIQRLEELKKGVEIVDEIYCNDDKHSPLPTYRISQLEKSSITSGFWVESYIYRVRLRSWGGVYFLHFNRSCTISWNCPFLTLRRRLTKNWVCRSISAARAVDLWRF